MIIRFTAKAEKQYSKLPLSIQVAVDKQFRFLQEDIHHRSIQVKRFHIKNLPDLWQGRITQRWRFYFRICPDYYEILAIVDHPKKGG